MSRAPAQSTSLLGRFVLDSNVIVGWARRNPQVLAISTTGLICTGLYWRNVQRSEERMMATQVLIARESELAVGDAVTKLNNLMEEWSADGERKDILLTRLHAQNIQQTRSLDRINTMLQVCRVEVPNMPSWPETRSSRNMMSTQPPPAAPAAPAPEPTPPAAPTPSAPVEAPPASPPPATPPPQVEPPAAPAAAVAAAAAPAVVETKPTITVSAPAQSPPPQQQQEQPTTTVVSPPSPAAAAAAATAAMGEQPINGPETAATAAATAAAAAAPAQVSPAVVAEVAPVSVVLPTSAGVPTPEEKR